jgi:HEAT repeat protein
VRRNAVSALSFSNMKTAGESIARALTDADWMVREVAADTLSISKAEVDAPDALIKALGDDYWQVRLKAARSLGARKIGKAVAAIGACLDHPQGNLRKECAAAIGEIGDPAGLQFVERLADDHDPDVRKNASWAIQRITSAQAAAQ